MPLKFDKLPGRQRNYPLKDYAGIRFGRLTGVSLVERDVTKENNHLWLFRCDCGTEKALRIKAVRSGGAQSCGCLFSEMLRERNTTHGLSRQYPREYVAWKCMRARCRNPTDSDYADYGGRGIKIVPRWNSFALFMADMGPCPEGLTLDRLDVNQGYSPGNCRWATAIEQANNKRNNHRLVIDGDERTLQEWARHFGMDHSKVQYRLRQGWPLTEVFSKEDFRLHERTRKAAAERARKRSRDVGRIT
jgi:hypothetical protein